MTAEQKAKLAKQNLRKFKGYNENTLDNEIINAWFGLDQTGAKRGGPAADRDKLYLAIRLAELGFEISPAEVK